MCSECSCSLCLFSHTAGPYHLRIGGFVGWEEGAPTNSRRNRNHPDSDDPREHSITISVEMN